MGRQPIPRPIPTAGPTGSVRPSPLPLIPPWLREHLSCGVLLPRASLWDHSGYADPLHQHLKTYLGNLLSDDPCRSHSHPGENGTIYVESRWPDTQGKASHEEGMKRLGTWCDDLQQVDITDAPLRVNDESISHVALVYSNLEPTGPEAGAALMTLGMSLFSVSHYASVSEL